jgi:hypothetical protein
MGRVTELPDDVYNGLERISHEHGLTVAEYIATTVPGRTASANGDDSARRRAVAWLRESGWHLGGPPYPSRDELYDRGR